MKTAEDVLLSELKKGSEQAYKSLFYAYFADLVLYAHGMLKDREAAEDLIQDFFIDFWYEKKYRRVDSGLEGYLYRSVRNTCLNYLRNEKRKNNRLSASVPELTDKNHLSFDDAERNREYEEIYWAYHRLPIQCKQIFTLCCLEGLKYQEAADRLGISINTVRTQMGRAFKFLRDMLEGKTFSSILFLLFNKLFRFRTV